MKKWIAIFLVLVLLAGCSAGDVFDLTAGFTANQVDQVELGSENAAITAFAVELFQAAMEEGENTLISPLSVLYALSMTANGADGETLAQMEQVLGLDVDTLNGWLHSYMESLPSGEKYELKLANSIWFRDYESLRVDEDFLQTNADYYESDIYKAAFDDSTKNAINDWVKEHTDGMIRQIVDEIPPEAMLYLVNALVFDAQWHTVYDKDQIRDGTFTTEDGLVQNVEMMYSSAEFLYLEDGLATGFIKYYAGRKYAFAAILPDEGISVGEYIDSLTGEHLYSLLSEPQNVDVVTRIPKFTTEYSVDMTDILKSMGMTNAFNGGTADFSKMGSFDDGNLYIGQVLHKTYISVDELGTKAGAVTSARMDTESAAIEPQVIKYVYLERPFIYLLIDCENNLPFFIGTVMDVNGG